MFCSVWWELWGDEFIGWVGACGQRAPLFHLGSRKSWGLAGPFVPNPYP